MGKYRNALIAVIAIVVLASAGYWWQKSSNPEESEPVNSSTQLKREAGDEDLASQPVLKGNMLEGLLRTSDNKSRGNLMIITSSSTIYISTGRDYGGLVGKEVKVLYDGTLEDFRLGDIIVEK